MADSPSQSPRDPFTVEFRVRYAETDQMGVVYHAEYLVWCEVGRTEFIRTHLRSYAKLEEEGLMLAVADASLRYHGGARYDELIRVETRLAEVRSRSLRFEYLVRRAETGEKLVTAATTLVAVDRSGRSMVIPTEVREAMELHVG